MPDNLAIKISNKNKDLKFHDNKTKDFENSKYKKKLYGVLLLLALSMLPRLPLYITGIIEI